MQVKIWKASESTSKKWVTVATIKIKEAGATAVAFSPVDQLHRYRQHFAEWYDHAHSILRQAKVGHRARKWTYPHLPE